MYDGRKDEFLKASVIRPPEEDSWTFPPSPNSGLEKLAFAISRQRLTLAGQEMAALQIMNQRGLLVTEVLKDILINNNC